MTGDIFEQATREAVLFYQTEITPEALKTLLKIRYPELDDSDVDLIVHEALLDN